MPTPSVLEFVVERLNAQKPEWARIATGSRVPLSTLKKIAYRHTKYPSIQTVESLANYLRRAQQRPSTDSAES